MKGRIKMTQFSRMVVKLAGNTVAEPELNSPQPVVSVAEVGWL